MQLSLFVDNADDNNECQYPNVEALTGYRYGCRCARCREAKARWRHPTSQCANAECEAPRMKHSRYCLEHKPPPNLRPRSQICQADCEFCGRSHSWYESVLTTNVRHELRDLYRRTCGNCRDPYIGAIKNHRLDAITAMRLIKAERCELCDKPFSIGAQGRNNSVVDHDHACCSGPHSCGRCIRGVLCHRCNHVIASVESVHDVGLDRVLEYLQRRH